MPSGCGRVQRAMLIFRDLSLDFRHGASGFLNVALMLTGAISAKIEAPISWQRVNLRDQFFF